MLFYLHEIVITSSKIELFRRKKRDVRKKGSFLGQELGMNVKVRSVISIKLIFKLIYNICFIYHIFYIWDFSIFLFEN